MSIGNKLRILVISSALLLVLACDMVPKPLEVKPTQIPSLPAMPLQAETRVSGGATTPPGTGTLPVLTVLPGAECIGWQCTIKGAVYGGSVSPGNGLEGAQVELEQASYCSPTQGKQNVSSIAGGAFEFQVYVHDTDTFIFRVEQPGYAVVEKRFAGTDCLYCGCPPLEIVLK